MDVNEAIAKYVFIKTGGLGLKPKGIEKSAGAIASGVQTVGDVMLSKIPLSIFGTALGTGGLWWLMNKEIEKDKALHRARMSTINSELGKLQEKRQENIFRQEGVVV